MISLKRFTAQDQDQDSLLVKRRNDNHSPGPVIRELVPSSHQRSELRNTIPGGPSNRQKSSGPNQLKYIVFVGAIFESDARPIGVQLKRKASKYLTPWRRHFTLYAGERGGSVVECRTPEREVRGSKPTASVLCPWARHFTPRKYWLITKEAVAPSRHNRKIVDWDVKPQHKQNKHFMPGLFRLSNSNCLTAEGSLQLLCRAPLHVQVVTDDSVTAASRSIWPSRVLGVINISDRHVFYFVTGFRWPCILLLKAVEARFSHLHAKDTSFSSRANIPDNGWGLIPGMVLGYLRGHIGPFPNGKYLHFFPILTKKKKKKKKKKTKRIPIRKS